MPRSLHFFSFFLLLSLLGCDSKPTKSAFGNKIIQLQIAGTKLQAEVAESPQASEIGLMFRDSLPENQGMLFPFEEPKQAGFWMKNTKIPLSIAYIDNSGKILEIYDMKPGEEEPVASVSKSVSYALEVNQGWFAKHNIAPGAKVKGLP